MMRRVLLLGGGVIALGAVVAASWIGSGGARVRAANTSRGIAPLKVVNCGNVISFSYSPPRRKRVLFERIALPGEHFLLRGHAAPENRPLHYYAKQGIDVRTRRQPVELIVPKAWRDQLAVSWGENGGPFEASVVRVLGCKPILGHRWLAYPGGYFLRKPACAPLIIHVGAQRARIRLSIGKRCPPRT